MLPAFLQDQATLYASGEMSAEQRDPFEIMLEFHDELRGFVSGLLEIGAALTQVQAVRVARPVPTGLKSRIGALIEARPQQVAADGLVASGPDLRVQWVNPAFSTLCGYTLDELRGQKLGPILQGAKTDRDAAERMRRAVHEYRPCREVILNYHKNGRPYWVEVAISPILDDDGQPHWVVARERELVNHQPA